MGPKFYKENIKFLLYTCTILDAPWDALTLSSWMAFEFSYYYVWRMGLLNHLDLEIDDHVPFCFFLCSFFNPGVELGCIKMSCTWRTQRGWKGGCMCPKSYHLSVFLLLQENLFSSPICKGGKIPKLCSPTLMKYNWIHMWLWIKAAQFFQYKNNIYLIFISETTLPWFYYISAW